MKDIATHLDTFDLLYWVDDITVGRDSHSSVRRFFIDLMGIGSHYCKTPEDCAICLSAESVFVEGDLSDLASHADAVKQSDSKRDALRSRGFDAEHVYAAARSNTTATVVRAIAYQTTMNDYGIPEYSKRGIIAFLGSALPTVLRSESFSRKAFDDLTVLSKLPADESEFDAANMSASSLVADFVTEVISGLEVGNINMGTTVERVDVEVFALADWVLGERDYAPVESHKILDAKKSHPILGRIAGPSNTWTVVSGGDGRSMNELMRAALSTERDPALNAVELDKFVRLVFAKWGETAVLSL